MYQDYQIAPEDPLSSPKNPYVYIGPALELISYFGGINIPQNIYK